MENRRRTRMLMAATLAGVAVAVFPQGAEADEGVTRVLLPGGYYATLAVPKGTRDLSKIHPPTARLLGSDQYHLMAVFVDPESADAVIPEEATESLGGVRYFPSYVKAPLFYAGFQVRIPLSRVTRSIDEAAFDALKEEFKAGKTVKNDVALKDFDVWAGDCVAEDDLILAPDLAEEMSTLVTSDEIFMEPQVETETYVSGLTMACVADPDRGSHFFLGTSSLLHVGSFALELFVYEEVHPREGISRDRVRRLEAKTQEWIEAIPAVWSSRFPPLDRSVLRQFWNPSRLFYLAGRWKSPILVLAMVMLVAVSFLRSRLPAIIVFALCLAPTAASIILFVLAEMTTLQAQLRAFGPLRTPVYDEAVSAGFTEPISVLAVGFLSTALLAAFLAGVRWRDRRKTAAA